MGWMGKIVGGTIGFAMGGPLGAVAGAVFGHAYDKSSEVDYAERIDYLSSTEETQFTFFVATFSMLAKLAKADGHVSKAEIDSIESFMAKDLNLTPDSRKIAINIFHAATDSPQSFHDFAIQFYTHFQNQPQLLEFMIDILLRLAVSDDSLSEIEENLIRSAVRTFNLSETEYRKLKSRYIDDFEKFYAILGSKKSDSDEQIKKQYRKLVREYHPDTIASKGLPEEFVKFAHDKFREIQEAYEAIKNERRFS
jgi:DnaJ like chaperone protein